MKYKKHKDNPEKDQKDSNLAKTVSGMPLKDSNKKSMNEALQKGWVSSMCYEHISETYKLI